MSRLLLLLVFVAWMSFGAGAPSTADAVVAGRPELIHCAWFMAGYAILVLAAGVWSRWAVRRIDTESLGIQLTRFNRAITLARMAVPAWFFVGVFFLGWGSLIDNGLALAGLHPDRFDSPGLMIGCVPALAAWVGLWWAQYPADVCFREQGLLAQLDAGLPIHRPPTLSSYLRVNFRLQILFTAVPILALIMMRDLLSLILQRMGLNEQDSLVIQLGVSVATAAVVLILAPELLRRILQTEPLPAGPLRERLEAVCVRHNIRYRDVLLWRTDYNMGNAAVMGVIPQTRYILMSDLLLETMTDEQIEAVFAHEVGHVIHKHMLWFAVFFAAVMLVLVGLSGPVGDWLDSLAHHAEWPAAMAVLAGAAGCLSFFLFISRKFERQADVFAARSIQRESTGLGEAHVGPHGATVFVSALNQVARINCIPITAWSAFHGSIAKRMAYLEGLSVDPCRTARFDRFMARLYGGMIVMLGAAGVWAIVTIVGQRGG
jgi:STE24 endopeptidase